MNQNEFHAHRYRIRLANFPSSLSNLPPGSHNLENTPGYNLLAINHPEEENSGHTFYKISPEFHYTDFITDRERFLDQRDASTNMPHLTLSIKNDENLKDATSTVFKNLLISHNGLIPHGRELMQHISTGRTTTPSEYIHKTRNTFIPNEYEEGFSPHTEEQETFTRSLPIEDLDSLKENAIKTFSYIFDSGLRRKYSNKKHNLLPLHIVNDLLLDSNIPEYEKSDNVPTYLSSTTSTPHRQETTSEHNLSPEESRIIDNLTEHHSRLLREYIEKGHSNFLDVLKNKPYDPLLKKYLHDLLTEGK